MAERFNSTLQENLLTLMGFNDEYGKVVVNLINADLFEGDYRIFAEHFISYWETYGKAPGMHCPDLVADVLNDPHNRKAGTYRRILHSMLQLSEGINTTYVLHQLRTFTRLQRLKDAILQSAEQLNSKQETAIDEIEEIWNELLRVQEIEFDAGYRLNDIDRVLNYLQQQSNEFQTGIKFNFLNPE